MKAPINIFETTDGVYVYDALVATLPLSTRTINTLYRAGIINVSQLELLTPKQFAGIRNLGKVRRSEVSDALREYLDKNRADEDAVSHFRTEINGIQTEFDEREAEEPLIEDVLDLSPRAVNCLFRGGIKHFSQLIYKTEKDLLSIRGLGEETMKEIFRAVHEFVPSPNDGPCVSTAARVNRRKDPYANYVGIPDIGIGVGVRFSPRADGSAPLTADMGSQSVDGNFILEARLFADRIFDEGWSELPNSCVGAYGERNILNFACERVLWGNDYEGRRNGASVLEYLVQRPDGDFYIAPMSPTFFTNNYTAVLTVLTGMQAMGKLQNLVPEKQA